MICIRIAFIVFQASVKCGSRVGVLTIFVHVQSLDTNSNVSYLLFNFSRND